MKTCDGPTTAGERLSPRLIVKAGHLVIGWNKHRGHRTQKGTRRMLVYLDKLSAFPQPWLFAREIEIVTHNVNDNDTDGITNSQHLQTLHSAFPAVIH